MTGFEPGLLDKLFDDDRRAAASAALRNLSLDEVKTAVARDLEALLNTRMVFTEEMLEGYSECQRSALSFGINDFSGLSLASFYDRAFICRSIEHAISRHEPRLRNVMVRLDVDGQASTGALFFGITAQLTLPALREAVSFDALLQPTTLQYAVTRTATRSRGF